MHRSAAAAVLLSCAGCLLFGPVAFAASVEEFYAGKQMTIIVSAGSSGAYTQTARVISKYLTQYIPGHPTFIVKNMPGAGHVLGTNFMYNQAPRDGSFIATVGSAIPLHQTLGGKGVRYDVRRFNWLGTTGISNQMGLTWHTSGVKSIAEAKQTELTTGATGAGAGTAIFPTMLNSVIGTRFKLVLGYGRNSDIDLAMERGEVQSHHSYSYSSLLRSHPDWVKDGKVNFLYQVGTDERSGVPGVPLMTDLAETAEQKQILQLMTIPSVLGRLYVAPPEVPTDRVAALRAAFTASVKDPAFVAESDKLGLDLFPSTGEEVTAMVQALVDTPPTIIEKAKQAMTVGSALNCEQRSAAKSCGKSSRSAD
jgi:tripartite-type tricarboxylate transporter receptor subunit TctC